MKLKRANLNDKITDTIDDFNDNWGTIEDSLELKANKQQEEWITPTLLNGWKIGLEGVWFYKDNLGLVHIQGSVAIESYVPNSVVFQLPIGYRPSTTLVFSGVRADFPDVVLYVEKNGNVKIVKTSVTVGSPITWLSLSQINFRVI